MRFPNLSLSYPPWGPHVIKVTPPYPPIRIRIFALPPCRGFNPGHGWHPITPLHFLTVSSSVAPSLYLSLSLSLFSLPLSFSLRPFSPTPSLSLHLISESITEDKRKCYILFYDENNRWKYFYTELMRAERGMAQYQRIKLYIKKRNLFISSKEFKIQFLLYANLSMRNFP